ncbi:hypothetical protein ABFS83_06G149100 [Erythranthe nasuta]
MEANIYTSYSETESESSSSESESEDNYINMEPGRDSSSFFENSNGRLLMINNKEFEFQSFSNSSSDGHAAQTTTSPADELFYMGKLLPLHLPPRLLHHQIQNDHGEQQEEEEYPFGGSGTPFFSTPTANTPFQSCNISPAESCHVSRELNPAEYFADYNNNNNNNNNNLSPELLGQQMKKSRLPKQSKNSNNSSSSFGIGSKLKWAYLKSLFTTSGCAAVDQSQQHLPKVKHYSHKSSAKVNTHAPPPPPPAFGQIKSKQKKSSSDYNNNIAKKENTTNNLVEGHHHHNRHRRSFSGAFKRISKTKKSSSSSSSTNSGTADSKRCGGGSSSEIDSSIQAAIAHCKRSQKLDKERTFCSISASYI